MPFLIDGHNLIPKLGINLADENDERELVAILQNFARITRITRIEIFFDRKAAHTNAPKITSSLKIHFVKSPKIADDAILDRLRTLRKDAKNWTVVSSDQYVQREAKSLGALVMSSDEFARMVRDGLANSPDPVSPETTLSEDEVDEWLERFRSGNKDQ